MESVGTGVLQATALAVSSIQRLCRRLVRYLDIVCVCVCAFTRYAASSRIFAPVRHGVFAVVGRAALTHGYNGDCFRSTVTAAASVFYLRFQPLLAYYAEQGLCTVRCPSVSLSVCPSMGPQQQTRCCRFAVVGRKRLIAARPALCSSVRRANAGSATLLAYVRS